MTGRPKTVGRRVKQEPSNPFSAKTVRAPRYVPAKVVPWTSGQRVSVRRELPERYRIAVDLGAGCGLRQGEIFAVSPDDIDPTRPVLHVVRQIKIVRGQRIFAPPKGGKLREVPLAESVHERLIAHAGRFEPVLVTCPGIPLGASQGPCCCTWSLRTDMHSANPSSTPTSGSPRSVEPASLMTGASACTSYDTPTPRSSSTPARHQGVVAIPRAQRSRLYAAHLHAPAAGQRGPHPPRDRSSLPQ